MKLVNSVLIPCATALLFWKAVKLTIDLEIDDPERISIGDFVIVQARRSFSTSSVGPTSRTRWCR